jgi:hypothetical protein
MGHPNFIGVLLRPPERLGQPPPRIEHVCGNCGANIRNDKTLCSKCAKQATRKNFRMGRKMAQRPEHLARRAETMRTHRLGISSWKPSELPGWLTRDAYVNQINPHSRAFRNRAYVRL